MWIYNEDNKKKKHSQMVGKRKVAEKKKHISDRQLMSGVVAQRPRYLKHQQLKPFAIQ